MRRRIAVDVPTVVISMIGVVAVTSMLGYFYGSYKTERRLQTAVSVEPRLITELARRFGPGRNSQHGEEWIVRDFFRDKRRGVFVDVGANSYQQYSNTYYLDTMLEWSGIAIDPQQKFAADYARYRPRTRFFALYVGDVPNTKVSLFVPRSNDLVASRDRTFAEYQSKEPVEQSTADATTLDDILDRSGLTHIDFLSIDIELAEPAALAGFSIERFRPELVCIEAHAEVRQQILEYFARHGYVLVGRYWQADPANFWFRPL